MALYTERVPIGASGAAGILNDPDDRTDNERLETAILATLSAIQDWIAVHTGAWWPYGAEGEMPMPGVQSRGRQIFAWYGDREATAHIRFKTIEISAIFPDM